jgi:hypothetical protein
VTPNVISLDPRAATIRKKEELIEDLILIRLVHERLNSAINHDACHSRIQISRIYFYVEQVKPHTIQTVIIAFHNMPTVYQETI